MCKKSQIQNRLVLKKLFFLAGNFLLIFAFSPFNLISLLSISFSLFSTFQFNLINSDSGHLLDIPRNYLYIYIPCRVCSLFFSLSVLCKFAYSNKLCGKKGSGFNSLNLDKFVSLFLVMNLQNVNS